MVKVAFVPSLVWADVCQYTNCPYIYSLFTAAVMEVEDYPEHLKAIIAQEEKWEELEKRREQLEREMCKVHWEVEGPACVRTYRCCIFESVPVPECPLFVSYVYILC